MVLPNAYGGQGQGGGFIFYTRNDDTVAVFTSTANRDTYFTTNPQELAVINGSQFAVGIGTVDGDASTVTEAFIYRAPDWLAIPTQIVGARGPQGSKGDKGDPGQDADFSSITAWNIPMVDGSGQPVDSGIRRLSNGAGDLESEATLIVPQESLQVGYSGVISAFGAVPQHRSYISGRRLIQPFTYWSKASGTERSREITLAATTDTVVQGDDSQSLSGTTGTFNVVATSSEAITDLYFRAPVGTGLTGLRFQATVQGQSEPFYYYPSRIAWEEGTGNDFADTGNDPNTMVIPIEDVPIVVFENQTIVVQYAMDSGTLLGDGTSPYLAVDRNIITLTDLAYLSEVRTDAALRSFVAAMFTGGTHQGITVDFDSQNGVINLEVTGTTPPVTPSPAVSNLAIDINSTISTGTDLNTSHTINFTTQGSSSIASLNLVVTTGDDVSLTVPTQDGNHTQSVTLSGISTANAGSITFQIRGTTSGGQTIMSNVVTVTVRAVTPDEQAYYGVRPTNDFVSVDLTNLTAVDVQPPGSEYTISGSWPATQYVGILEPTDRPITSIVETAFNSETLSRWTRTANARTISGQTYDLLTLLNNGPTGNFEFRVTHG